MFSFSINICYGWRETGGIYLFHFDIRFPKSHVVTDANIDGPGLLGYEITNFTSHFRKGNDFLVEIICEKDKFHVSVDGDYFLEYKYKLPLKTADMLYLAGVRDRDVQIYSVDVNNLSNATKWVSPSARTNFDLNESGTSDNNCTCDSESPFLVQIPFVAKLANKLSVGTKITVSGRILPRVYWFAINIRQNWKDVGGINLFHFNPRLDGPNVITGTHIEGVGWINFGHHSFPYGSHFQKGNNFTVEIECQKEQFSVKLDGNHFLVSKYMLPVEVADVLEIKTVRNQDVEIFSVDTKLDNGPSVGTKITVKGRILLGAFRFAINIRHGWTEEGGTFLFHFNPRYDEPNVIIDVHIWGHGWINYGICRYPKGSHFRKGSNFTVEIVCEEDQFNVTVDGQPFLEFKYMLPLRFADMLEINGVRNRDV
ncbi:unnamed protein product [Orchesella dallaii]|uniref:Galectin n=1 Tax=Orchesella dallaii TaxID=48710 RepID=A0ABP1PJZ7_9HEXA